MAIVVDQKYKGLKFKQTDPPSTTENYETWFRNSYDNALVSALAGDWGGLKGKTKEGPGTKYGYICGGIYSGYQDTTYRLTFPILASGGEQSSDLTADRAGIQGCNSSTKGWLGLGYNGSGDLLNVDTIAFPFDDAASLSAASFTNSAKYGTSFNSSAKGYAIGGTTNNNYVRNYLFSDNGSTTYENHDLGSTTVEGLCAGCNSSLNGFVMGGYSTSQNTRISFVSGSVNYDWSSLPQVYTYTVGANSSMRGFQLGGLRYGSSPSTYCNWLDFVNSGIGSLTSKLSQARTRTAGFNSTTFAYIVGGQIGGSGSYSDIEVIYFPFGDGEGIHVGDLDVSGSISRTEALGLDGVDQVSMLI